MQRLLLLCYRYSLPANMRFAIVQNLPLEDQRSRAIPAFYTRSVLDSSMTCPNSCTGDTESRDFLSVTRCLGPIRAGREGCRGFGGRSPQSLTSSSWQVTACHFEGLGPAAMRSGPPPAALMDDSRIPRFQPHAAFISPGLATLLARCVSHTYPISSHR